ncbi:MAG: glycosyltransferase [Magnetococcus sp. YQC-5]
MNQELGSGIPPPKSTREIFLETVLRLDDDNDIDGLIAYGSDFSHNPHDIYIYSVSQLIILRRIRAAYILSMIFKNRGYTGPFIAIALAMGGMIYQNPIEYARGLEDLADIVDFDETDRILAWQQTNLYYLGIIPAIIHLLDLESLDGKQVLEFYAAMRSAVPFVWTFFEEDQVIPVLSLEDLGQRDRVKNRLFTTHQFIKKIVQIEEERKPEDFVLLIEFLQNNQHAPHDLLLALLILLVTTKTGAAFICGMLLANSHYNHPLISVALAIGGLCYNNQEEEMRGLKNLRSQMNAFSLEQQKLFFKTVTHPNITVHIYEYGKLNHAHENIQDWMKQLLSNDKMMHLLAIFQAAAPFFWNTFDLNQSVPDLDPEELRRRGWAKARLVHRRSPPKDAPRQPRRVVVAMREFSILNHSELSPLGERIVAAMSGYGWNAHLFNLQFGKENEYYKTIIEQCLSIDAEVLILDYDFFYKQWLYSDKPKIMIMELKQKKPSIKIVACLLDSWCVKDALNTNARLFDVLWTTDAPSLPLWSEPDISSKVLQCLIPIGLNMKPDKPLRPYMLFSGEVRYSWIRLFWLLLAVNKLNLPIQQKICTHQDDGLPVLDSYAIYLRGLADATCCINFSMRPDLSYIYNGRCPETLLSGSLLVQETSYNIDYFFVAGEHYLEFSSVSELAAIARFITKYPEAAEEIRRRGNAFACEQFRDEKIIGYIDYLCFFSGLEPNKT